MGNFDLSADRSAPVRIIASEKTWIEGEAVRQLEQTAKLPGMVKAVGMPDLHAGRGCPIGAAFVSRDWIYPFLVGNDIGCGMGLWKTQLKASRIKREKWAKRLFLDEPWDGDTASWLAEYELNENLYSQVLGTIGGGNHFAELLAVEKFLDESACQNLGLEKQWLYLLVHSGSRGLGQDILDRHLADFGTTGLRASSQEAADYRQAHTMATAWAGANRALIAHRFLRCLRSEGARLLDLNHNTVTPVEHDGETLWLHRKGASPSDHGPLVIPGSRGSFSYLVEPIDSSIENGFSLAHGAGRKWNRTKVRQMLHATHRLDSFYKTHLGSLVICEDRALVFEEAPQAYKNIDSVIGDLVAAGLIRVLAILRPVLTYKTRRRKK